MKVVALYRGIQILTSTSDDWGNAIMSAKYGDREFQCLYEAASIHARLLLLIQLKMK